jgi:hypothetical protein
MYKYNQMDRSGKKNTSKFKYRKVRELRMVYMSGYIEAQDMPVLSRTWYVEKFGVSRATLYLDIKELSELYPQIIWIK